MVVVVLYVVDKEKATSSRHFIDEFRSLLLLVPVPTSTPLILSHADFPPYVPLPSQLDAYFLLPPLLPQPQNIFLSRPFTFTLPHTTRLDPAQCPAPPHSQSYQHSPRTQTAIIPISPSITPTLFAPPSPIFNNKYTKSCLRDPSPPSNFTMSRTCQGIQSYPGVRRRKSACTGIARRGDF